MQSEKFCGDGHVDAWEACDDGNQITGDGCRADCRSIEPGFTCTTPAVPCVTTCGDGILAGQEGCDDGNVLSGDGCSSKCQVEVLCTRKDAFEKFRRPQNHRHTIFSQGLQMNLEHPVLHQGNPDTALRAPVPVLDGTASCAGYKCPAGCKPASWMESRLCLTTTCGSDDVKRCCDCNDAVGADSGASPSWTTEPCFSWDTSQAGRVSPTAEDVIAACGGALGYVFGTVKSGKFLVRHDVVLPSRDAFKKAMSPKKDDVLHVWPVSQQFQSLSFKAKRTTAGFRFGFHCAGSEDDCQLWQVLLGSNITRNGFLASQKGGVGVRPRAVAGSTFVIYKIQNPTKVWTCPAHAPTPHCGDGVISGVEECDAVSAAGSTYLHGCNAACQVSEGWGCSTSPEPHCSPLCGDSLVLGNETCDDGTTFRWGGCTNDCRFHTQLSYIASTGGCDASAQTKSAATAEACEAACTVEESCVGYSWRMAGGCSHISGPLPTSFGQGPETQADNSHCKVKARYLLLKEGLQSVAGNAFLHEAHKQCRAHGLKPVSVSSVQELDVVYDFVKRSGLNLSQPRGVPIGLAIEHDRKNSYFDLSNASSELDALLATAYRSGRWQTSQWMSNAGDAEIVGFGFGNEKSKQRAGLHDWRLDHYPSGLVCEDLKLPADPQADGHKSITRDGRRGNYSAFLDCSGIMCILGGGEICCRGGTNPIGWWWSAKSWQSGGVPPPQVGHCLQQGQRG